MHIIILSKAPVAGRVKTRLQPQYSAQEAANIQMQMTEAVLAKALASGAKVTLAVDDPTHPFFGHIHKTFSVPIIAQGTGNLGERMIHLLGHTSWLDQEPIMFIGSDSPHVPIARYQQAEALIADCDVVIGPVEDGGYDLLYLAKNHAEVLIDIPWSTPNVFSKTINNINKLGLLVKLLDESFDLDTAADIARAPISTWRT